MGVGLEVSLGVTASGAALRTHLIACEAGPGHIRALRGLHCCAVVFGESCLRWSQRPKYPPDRALSHRTSSMGKAGSSSIVGFPLAW